MPILFQLSKRRSKFAQMKWLRLEQCCLAQVLWPAYLHRIDGIIKEKQKNWRKEEKTNPKSEWRTLSLTNSCWCCYPWLVSLPSIQVLDFKMMLLRCDIVFYDFNFLTFVQNPNVNGVLGDDSVWSTWWQPTYYYRWFSIYNRFNTLRWIGHCLFSCTIGCCTWTFTRSRKSKHLYTIICKRLQTMQNCIQWRCNFCFARHWIAAIV